MSVPITNKFGSSYKSVDVQIHTIELFVHTPPAGFRSTIESHLGRKISIKACRGPRGYVHGYRAIVNDPTRDILPVLQELVDQHRDIFTHRVDVAIDFRCQDEFAARNWKAFLVRHVMMKWPPRHRQRGSVGDSDYWVRLEKGRRRPSRNIIAYPKHEGTSVRFELRFLGSGPVRRAGLSHLPTLIDLNPTKLLDQYIKIVDIKPGTMKRLLRQHRDKAARARAIIDRMTIQDFLEGRRRPERFVQRYPISALKIPTTVTLWPASGNHH